MKVSAVMVSIAAIASASGGIRAVHGAFVSSGPPLLRALSGARRKMTDASPLHAWAPLSATGRRFPARSPASTASFATMQTSNKFELEGQLRVVYDLQTFASGFQKREFVVTTNEMYPQEIKFELVKDKCSVLDSIPLGSNIKVKFNIRGNLWNEKYFVNLQAWYLEVLQGGADQFDKMEADMQDWNTSPGNSGGSGGVAMGLNDLGGVDAKAPASSSVWDQPMGDKASASAAPVRPAKVQSWDEDIKF